jgi:hypothetical protein
VDEAARRVQQAAADARSNDDLVRDEFEAWSDQESPASPLDEETFDERASTQMGEPWESRRRDAE